MYVQQQNRWEKRKIRYNDFLKENLAYLFARRRGCCWGKENDDEFYIFGRVSLVMAEP